MKIRNSSVRTQRRCFDIWDTDQTVITQRKEQQQGKQVHNIYTDGTCSLNENLRFTFEKLDG